MLSVVNCVVFLASLRVFSLGMPVEEMPAAAPNLNLGLNLLAGLSSNVQDAKSAIIQQGLNVLQGPPVYIENANIEQESLLSKADSTYTTLHEFFANLFQYKPIVDTIQESARYGNDGGKFKSLGKIFIRTTEGLGNILNSVIELPYELFRQLSLTANEKLNHLGGKIVGLE